MYFRLHFLNLLFFLFFFNIFIIILWLQLKECTEINTHDLSNIKPVRHTKSSFFFCFLKLQNPVLLYCTKSIDSVSNSSHNNNIWLSFFGHKFVDASYHVEPHPIIQYKCLTIDVDFLKPPEETLSPLL